MVVQKTWGNAETTQQNPTEESSASWQFQQPTKAIQSCSNAHTNMQTRRPTITRQIAINTLAAMHRRFSLPGPVQPHSRPIAEFRACANKSLDILRQTVQSAVTREIDQVIKKYLEKFFVPAVTNIRLNLGEEAVSEDQVRAVCRAMLDATRLLYAVPPRPAPSPYETSDSESSNGTDFRFTKQSNFQSPPYNKRKESDTDSDGSGTKRKRVKLEENTDSGSSSPLPPLNQRDPEKWNPVRLTQDTLFIMGSHAHKVLGLGNSRGWLYTKHAGLLRYPADSADKEWIASHNLVNAVGGKTYIMVLEDIEELATSDMYRHNSLPMLGELTGFKVPPFMLHKIKSFVMKKSFYGETMTSPDCPRTVTLNEEQRIKLDAIKLEVEHNSNQGNEFNDFINKSKQYSDIDDMSMGREDFADIKVDGIKVEDIDDIKVEGMDDIDDIKVKVEDLDVDSIKVENIDDINIDGIKVEDIKLENDDTLSVCKETGNESTADFVDGLLDADIDFLSRNLGNIESEIEVRKTIEHLTGANPDTITLVGDEFDFGTTLNTNNYPDNQTTKCITVASTTSGMVHSVPVAHLSTPTRITGSTVHYYTSTAAMQSASQKTIHHLPQGTVTVQSIPGSSSQIIRSIPINTKSGTISTVMSQGTASIIGFGSRTTPATIIGTSTQYVNVTSKTFPTGNILHNAIVSRNFINRSNFSSVTTYSITSMRPMVHTTTPKLNTMVSNSCHDLDIISTTKDMIDNACNSSVMLKKVLTLGSAGTTKSFMMHNTQKVLSTGFANGSSPPPNVTIVSSGNNFHSSPNLSNICNIITPTTSTLSASHATLSALLSSSGENIHSMSK